MRNRILLFFVSFVILASTISSAQTTRLNSRNKKLERELVKMGERDQVHRHRMLELMNELSGQDGERASAKLSDVVGKQDAIDRDNRRRLEVIISKHGWPAMSLVGRKASQAAFLIVQHAGLDYQKKYFPLLKEAAAKNEAQPSDVAALEDRILKTEGKKQIYGTQINLNGETKKMELWPIQDEENVDSRRASVGLEPIAEYLKRFGLEYSPTKKRRND